MGLNFRHTWGVAALAVLALLLSGCGSDSPKPKPAPAVTTAPEPATTTDDAATQDTDSAEDDAESDAEERVPTAAAISVGRRLDGLVNAYRPVTNRTSFVTAARRLLEDAEDVDAGDEVLTERAGAVRVELRRFRAVLETGRRAVAAAPTPSLTERRLQRQLARGIALRLQALTEMERSLDLDSSATATDTDRTAADATWRASWGQSVRTAREALTYLQDTREELALEPAREDSIR